MNYPAIDRRQFIKLNVAALAGAALTPPFAKGNEHSPEQNTASPSGFYRLSLGDTEITIINDGAFQLSEITPEEMEPVESLAFNVDEEPRQEYFRSRFLHTGNPRLLISPVLIDSGGQRVLVDSGWSGTTASPTAGRLLPSMEMLGIPPESVDVVVLTHGHPDHLGGLLYPDGETPVYPNAEIVLTEAEVAFWTGDDASPMLQNPLLAHIPGVFETFDERLRIIRPGDEVASGIQSISSPGHTPGHISLGLEAGGRQLLLTGDAIVNIHTSFERPDWHNFFDLEPEQAAGTRRRLLDQAATDEMLILGYHFPFPGLGYALEEGDAYRWYSAGTTTLP